MAAGSEGKDVVDGEGESRVHEVLCLRVSAWRQVSFIAILHKVIADLSAFDGAHFPLFPQKSSPSELLHRSLEFLCNLSWSILVYSSLRRET